MNNRRRPEWDEPDDYDRQLQADHFRWLFICIVFPVLIIIALAVFSPSPSTSRPHPAERTTINVTPQQ